VGRVQVGMACGAEQVWVGSVWVQGKSGQKINLCRTLLCMTQVSMKILILLPLEN